MDKYLNALRQLRDAMVEIGETKSRLYVEVSYALNSVERAASLKAGETICVESGWDWISAEVVRVKDNGEVLVRRTFDNRIEATNIWKRPSELTTADTWF